ncbi:trefoil factor 1 [Tamandua tetradactyla]|uniref:trefoil factor 1 n=1 Tax=Tamandua tetradactyla TaxID=48850 RepID=UPI0040546BFB
MELKVTCILAAALLLALGTLAQEQAETCDMHPQERRNCGWPGVKARECREKGCCFDDTVRGFPWCFHPLAVNQEEECLF